MSGQPIVNIVVDDEMSSQGSVNALVAAPNIGAQVQALARQQNDMPYGLPLWPQYPMAQAMQATAPIAQSSVFLVCSGVEPSVPVARGSVQSRAITPTVPWMYSLARRPRRLSQRYHQPSKRCPQSMDKSKEVCRYWRTQWRR